MASLDREQLEDMYKQCKIKTEEELLAMCALYITYRILAKLSPCDAAREVIKKIKKNKQTEVKTNEQEKVSNT